MTDAEQLTMLKVLTNSRKTDEELSTYLDLAGKKILAKAYPYQEADTVPTKYHYLQVEIAAYMVNKSGADYESAHTENGISRTYESPDVPPSMLRTIIPYCGAIKHADDDGE